MRTMRTVRLLQGELKHSNILPVQRASRKGSFLLINTVKEPYGNSYRKNKKMKTSEGKRNCGLKPVKMESWEKKNPKINFLFEKVISDLVIAQLGVWFNDPKVLILECFDKFQEKKKQSTK